MSAYSSLPGTFLPFFSFGGNSPSKNSDDSPDDARASSHEDTAAQRQQITPTSSISCPNLSFGASTAYLEPSHPLSLRSSLPDLKTSNECTSLQAKSTSSPASEIFIAINNARVDTVQLIQSLTTRGSNIARRTANFISRSSETQDASETTATYKRSDTCETDAQTVHSKPSLCYEDSDSEDDDMSFYDYGDDEDYMQSTLPEQMDEDHSVSSKSSQDKDAIQFELFINFQGREYRAFRAFSTFVQLRNDLLRDRTVPSTVSIPELPSLNDESRSTNSGFHALAHSGFRMLQATAKMYIPVMELWLRNVVEAVPSSPILSQFLWEPLSSSTAGWNDIDEIPDKKSNSDGTFPKPSQPLRNKARQNNNPSLRYKSKSYSTSLSSITELLDES